MNSLMRYLSVGARIVCGTAAYLLVMAAVVIPTALELAGNFGMSVSVRDAWLGISAITITASRWDWTGCFRADCGCVGYGGTSASCIAELETDARATWSCGDMGALSACDAADRWRLLPGLSTLIAVHSVPWMNRRSGEPLDLPAGQPMLVAGIVRHGDNKARMVAPGL